MSFCFRLLCELVRARTRSWPARGEEKNLDAHLSQQGDLTPENDVGLVGEFRDQIAELDRRWDQNAHFRCMLYDRVNHHENVTNFSGDKISTPRSEHNAPEWRLLQFTSMHSKLRIP
jgi:hypothetical protein